MSTLNHYLTQWNLREPRTLAQTPTSHVYRVMDGATPVVLKILTPLGTKDEAAGAVALRYFGGRGAVRLLNADGGAHLLEYAAGDEVVTLVEQGEDDRATEIIAAVLAQLHSVTGEEPPAELWPLRRWYRGLFHFAEKPDAPPIFKRAAAIAEALLSEPHDVRVLHGDIHHTNIRASERGWLAFDPKGLVGERAFDACNALCNPISMPELVTDEKCLHRQAAILSENLGLDHERLLMFGFTYACLSASWSLAVGEDASLALWVAEVLN